MSRSVIVSIIEKTFLLTRGPGVVVILDALDELPDGYRIRSHDLGGELPEILIARGPELKEGVALEACKLYAVTIRSSSGVADRKMMTIAPTPMIG